MWRLPPYQQPNTTRQIPIEDIFLDMKDAHIFIKLDLRKGYHQIPIAEWNVVPYGLKNAPPFFQRTMDRILASLRNSRCYIDDFRN